MLQSYMRIVPPILHTMLHHVSVAWCNIASNIAGNMHNFSVSTSAICCALYCRSTCTCRIAWSQKYYKGGHTLQQFCKQYCLVYLYFKKHFHVPVHLWPEQSYSSPAYMYCLAIYFNNPPCTVIAGRAQEDSTL